MGTLFLNSRVHELQKLNCYNRVYFNYLHVFELDLEFVVVCKMKSKYLKVGEMFLQAPHISFLFDGVCFHN